MKFIEESVDECLKFYGERIDTPEAKKDAFIRFGYNIYQLAVEKFYFDKEEHPVRQDWVDQVEKYREQNAGIATSKTWLPW